MNKAHTSSSFPNDGSFDDPFVFERGSNYATLKFQQELIRDPLFKGLCKDVIMQNKHLFEDKIVLEVDCGIGMLSMLVSKFAKKVISLEASNIVDLLSKSIVINNISNIRVVKDDIDNVQSLPDDIKEVDIVMSQYMGYLCYDRTLLATLLKARDKFLKPKGIMMPDCIRIVIFGVDFGPRSRDSIAKLKMSRVMNEPEKELVPKSIMILYLEKNVPCHTSDVITGKLILREAECNEKPVMYLKVNVSYVGPLSVYDRRSHVRENTTEKLPFGKSQTHMIDTTAQTYRKMKVNK